MPEPAQSGLIWTWYDEYVAPNEPHESSSLPTEVFKRLKGRKKKNDWHASYESREAAISDYLQAKEPA